MTRLFDLDFQLLHDTVLAAIAVFVLFLFLSYLLFNPVRKMLEDRKMKIKTDLDTAKLDKEDAAALKAEYDAKLKNIEKEAEEILSEARQKALKNEAKIVDEAKEELSEVVDFLSNPRKFTRLGGRIPCNGRDEAGSHWYCVHDGTKGCIGFH